MIDVVDEGLPPPGLKQLSKAPQGTGRRYYMRLGEAPDALQFAWRQFHQRARREGLRLNQAIGYTVEKADGACALTVYFPERPPGAE